MSARFWRFFGCLALAFAVAVPAAATQPRGGIGCGDGIVAGEEECDDGVANGTTPCGCQLDCTLPEVGTSCASNECELHHCDGEGSCVFDFAPEETPCGNPEDTECDNPDSCDGSGVCQTHTEADETPCTDGLFCTGSDSCQSGLCVSPGDPCEPGVEICREQADQCVASAVFDDDFESGDLTAWSLFVTWMLSLP